MGTSRTKSSGIADLEIPYPGTPVPTTSYQLGVVRAPRNVADAFVFRVDLLPLVAAQLIDEFKCGHVPNVSELVCAATRQAFAVVRKANLPDFSGLF